jgi:hypothetical protein
MNDLQIPPRIVQICRAQANGVRELGLHFEAKHPKETFNEATHALYI